MQVIAAAGNFTWPAGGAGSHWAEHLRVADLSVGTYSVPRGGADDQVPHTEDEIYVVTAGQAGLEAGGGGAPGGPRAGQLGAPRQGDPGGRAGTAGRHPE